MDCQEYTTEEKERQRGQHLGLSERGTIGTLHRLGYSRRAIAREINCSPTTVSNELKRGTAPRKSNRGRAPVYSPKRGHAVYKANRQRSHRHRKLDRCERFLKWIVTQFREQDWSLDSCVGYAKRQGLFPEDTMVCTKTLYNALWRGELPLSLTDMPDVLKRKNHEKKSRENKRIYGTSIEERPVIAGQRTETGHWEGDTVVGNRAGKESVVLTLVEKKTRHYIALLIKGKTSEAVLDGLAELREEYGERFADVFKTITVDNGTEFADFSCIECWGAKVYFAHPYSSWERPQNERHNGLLRFYVPKGTSMNNYSAEYILQSADKLNSRPRRVLGYSTPEELFDAFLDEVYAVA